MSTNQTPQALILDDVERAVDAILARIGKTIVIGLPLGLGKPVELVNALYRRAAGDPALTLRILTALSLEKPRGSSELENKFLAPFVERVFGSVPELDYMRDLRAGRLPPNVEVSEFFFRAGSLLDNAQAQRRYISSNYTMAARDVFNQGCNVVAQIVCKRDTPEGPRYSLSCNPDTSPQLHAMLKASGRAHIALAVVNQNLPYMAGDAEVDATAFDVIVDHPRYNSRLFSAPRLAVATADYMIGLHASALVKDGGTLQIGIGALGDAIVQALLLRHRDNAIYRQLLDDCSVPVKSGELVREIGGDAPFEQGLYGASEMFVDGFMQLYKGGILKRRVYDFWALQRLINEGRCDPENLRPEVLDRLDALGVRALRAHDFEILQHHGFFNEGTRYDTGHLIAPDGTRVIANVADPQARKVMAEQCLGKKLRNGLLLHGAFFLGPEDFYAALRAMSDEDRAQICMTGVDKVNQLDLNPRLYKEQRVHARFMNTGIMATLSGGFVSDGLDDGRVISGVGGQYNFVAMAHQLPTGRSILMLRAVREGHGGASSNIVFNYGHCTISRHLRDIVITEYGIADLRSRSDSAVAKALIDIADSRFQQDLLEQAQRAGKIEAGYRIPDAYRNNLPAQLDARLASQRTRLPAFPFGSDFTDDEIRLGAALKVVKAQAAQTPKWRLVASALLRRGQAAPPDAERFLQWLGLKQPRNLQDKVVRMLLLEQLENPAHH